MDIDIYRSASNDERFLSVPADTNLESLLGVAPDFTGATIFKRGVSIRRGEPRIGLNPDEVIDQIEARGYAQHSAGVRFKTSGW